MPLTNFSLLEACYDALLGREPDEGARDHWRSVDCGPDMLRALLTTILDSPEFALRCRAAPRALASDDGSDFFNQQSQFGEIGRLLVQIVNASASAKTVVDVGANGRARSNSYDLMRYFGWKGLLIEANPNRCEVIKAEFDGLDYDLISCAVSDYTGQARFFLGANDDVSSLDAETTAHWGAVRGEIAVPVRTLPSILAEYGIARDFDVLSIDAEGEDARILNDTVEKGYCPAWVIMEAVHDQASPELNPRSLSSAVRALYRIVDSTVANLILRRDPAAPR